MSHLSIMVFPNPADEVARSANPSPFCVKLELYCKAASVPYDKPKLAAGDMGPTGKLPYAKFTSTDVVSDSAVIIARLIKDGFELDADLEEAQKVQARLIATMCEDKLYFTIVYFAWQVDANWPGTRAEFFSSVPCVLRGFISKQARKGLVGALRGQGMGRRPKDEVVDLGKQVIDDLSFLLGDKRNFFDTPKITTADVVVYAMLERLVFADLAVNPIGEYVKTKPTLMAFISSIAEQYFPEYHANQQKALAPSSS
ncbi:hypothetical protein CTAYLR_008193 [Chrysophaeum taylorii]|uniref:Glutathione S-transferase n=1 Tax=Chrysophaeum taylorii TaxID=2483200 RepID=A0AAD7UAU8_9STRA|nr:hypothetical protein CTAYLR_008193 [Chrysophaeum taylorii]